MRVLFSKIRCPSFICFCKPTSHINTPGPLKVENIQDVSSTTTVVSVSDVDHENSEDKEGSLIDGKKQQKQDEEEAEQQDEETGDNCVKSILKKEDSKEVQRKKVQWMDFLGKELVEIREFEASEIEDTDSDFEYSFSKVCVCTIL